MVYKTTLQIFILSVLMLNMEWDAGVELIWFRLNVHISTSRLSMRKKK